MAKSTKPRFDAAASITDEFIGIIDRSVLSWRKPWCVGGSSQPLTHSGEPRTYHVVTLTLENPCVGR